LAVLLALCGCTQMRQGPMTPADQYGAAALEEGVFVSFDGAPLGMQSWLPEDEPKAIIAAIHGMSDYSEAFFLAGPYWASQGYATYAFDQRGFGRSPKRGVWPEHNVMMADIAYFVAALRAQYPGKPVILVGHSMGAAGALASLRSATPPEVDGLVLIAPAVWGWSQMNFAYGMALRLAAGVAPAWALTGEGLNRAPTDNIAVMEKMSRDPLMLFATRVDALYGLVELMEQGWRTAPPADLPTLILMGEKDQIVPPAVIRRYAQERAPDACFLVYEHGYHLLERDLQAENVWRDIASFVEGRCPAAERERNQGAAAPLTQRTADGGGDGQRETDRSGDREEILEGG